MLSCFNNIKKITLEVLYHMALFFFFCFETTLYTSCINKRYDYVLLQGPFTYSLVNQSIHQMYGEARDSLVFPRLFHILPIPLH